MNDVCGSDGNDEKELRELRNEVSRLKDQKNDLERKLNLVLSELCATKGSVERMQTGSRTLHEVLGKQKLGKHGLGYVDGVSTSNSKGNTIFIKGTIQNENTSISPTITRVNLAASAPKENVFRTKFIYVCHHCGVKGHIQSHC